MANTALFPMRMSYQEGGYSTGVNFSTPEAATQTFSDGALVVISGGGVTQCGANPTRIDGVAVGAGNNYASQTADGLHNHMFTLPDTDIIYEMSIDKASAQGGALAVLAASTVGATYGVTLDTGGTNNYWYLDVDKSAANQRVLVIGFPVWSPPATVNGRVFVKFLSANVLQ